MKPETRRKRRYPKKWSKERVKFENDKRAHLTKKTRSNFQRNKTQLNGTEEYG